MNNPPNLIREVVRTYGGPPVIRWWVLCIRCKTNGHLIVAPKKEQYLVTPWPCRECRKKEGRKAYQDEQIKYGVRDVFGKAPQHVPPIQDIR